jgi:excinuclease ABC subunit C
MKIYSISQNFESAIIARNQLESVNYIVSGWRNVSDLFENINLPEDRSLRALNELFLILKTKALRRLECFDISQLGSKYFVGSMVVWQDGRLDKSQYRKFRIKTKFTPDDQYMIKEIVYRRLQHPQWGRPDLIIVDGGKPQVSAVFNVIANASEAITLIGLAKKHETIIFENQEINLPRHSAALRLLQSLRDEAHRFANQYRRQLLKQSLHPL